MVFETLLQDFNESFINIAAAVGILLIGLVIGRFAGKLVQQFLRQLEINKTLRKSRIKTPVEELVGNLVRYIIYLLVIILALNQIGLTSKVFYALTVIIIILLIIFIILALKDFIPNFMSGIFVLQRKNIRKGDNIKINNIEGTVIDITITELKLKTKDNEIMIIPNAMLQKNIIRKKL